MAVDLDTLTVPENPHDVGREVFDPVNAWPNAPARIVVAAYRNGPSSVFQIGADPATNRNWLRILTAPGQAWSEWKEAGTGGTAPSNPPVPIDGVMANSDQSVFLHFDLMLDSASVPATSAFAVTRNGAARTVLAARVSGTDVVLDMSAPMNSGTILCSYTPPGVNNLKSIDGIDVAAFTDYPIRTVVEFWYGGLP